LKAWPGTGGEMDMRRDIQDSTTTTTMTSHPITPFYEYVSPLCRHDGSKESTFIFFLSFFITRPIE
jgi:hypothetical protein